MVNPKIDTLKNHFRLHECKFENTSNYLASKLTSDNNIQRLREILAQLQTIAAKLEEISEQMSAFMTLDDLEPFLQKSADFSLILIHYGDKIDDLTQSGPSRSSTCAPFERRCEDSPSAPTNPASQQQQDFATAPNNTPAAAFHQLWTTCNSRSFTTATSNAYHGHTLRTLQNVSVSHEILQMLPRTMKLQDILQPKVQYNHQIENKVAIINFGNLLLNYWYFFSK